MAKSKKSKTKRCGNGTKIKKTRKISSFKYRQSTGTKKK